MTLTVFLYIVFTVLVKVLEEITSNAIKYYPELSAEVVTKSFKRVSAPNVNVSATGPTLTVSSLLSCALKITQEKPCLLYFMYNTNTKSCSAGQVSSTSVLPVDSNIYILNKDDLTVIDTKIVNFTEAENYCKGIGGHLVKFDCLEELSALSLVGWYWVGIADFDGDQVFHWTYGGARITNTSLTEFVDNSNSAYSSVGNCCVYCAVHKKLHIRPCGESNRFICEMK